MKKLLYSLAFVLSANFLWAQCGTTTKISSNITIDVSNTASYATDFSNATGTSYQLLINENITVQNGATLTIKGTPSQQFTVLMPPAHGFKVEKGGTLILEYCDIKSNGSGTCSPAKGFDSWNGILVYGDASTPHYDSYDLTGGWDPYAEPFKPWGMYNASHGRLQMRWCNVRDIQKELDGVKTVGLYAVKSIDGGILDIIDTYFTRVRSAVVVENYDRAQPYYLPREMNAFNIIDCDFVVDNYQRSSVGNSYNYCIELLEAQRVCIEGCHFSSTGIEDTYLEKSEAVKLNRSSAFFHKSGNFRRDKDIAASTAENAYCLLYGNNQPDLTGYPPSHPWLTSNSRKCEFTGWYRGIDAINEGVNNPAHTVVIDDAIFNHNFFPIRFEQVIDGTVTNSSFTFDQVTAGSSGVWDVRGNGDQFNGANNSYQELEKYDRIDISVHDSKNTLISGNTFTSDYVGDQFNIAKTIYVAIIDRKDGKFYEPVGQKPIYIYDLAYNNTFDPAVAVHGKDIGIYSACGNVTNQKNWLLMNCNLFQNLNYGVFVGQSKTDMIDQFHYTDMRTGRDAPALNTFSSNTCNIGYAAGYATSYDYYYKNGGSAPSDCGGQLNGVQSSTSEISVCPSMNCESFPMVHTDQKSDLIEGEAFGIYPNPSINGRFNVVFKDLEENAIFHVYSSEGKLIYKKTILPDRKRLSLDLNISSGIYIATLKTQTRNLESKLVVTQ